MNNSKRKEICRNYLKSRSEFLELANTDKILKGNDNIIGRIGEFIAFQFLEIKGRNPEPVTTLNNPGYDIICDGRIKTKISVKLITHENKAGQTSKIHKDWEELIIIILGSNYQIKEIGHLTKIQFKQALNEDNRWNNETPYCRSTMLNKNGLIGIYGVVYNEQELTEYSLI